MKLLKALSIFLFISFLAIGCGSGGGGGGGDDDSNNSPVIPNMVGTWTVVETLKSDTCNFPDADSIGTQENYTDVFTQNQSTITIDDDDTMTINAEGKISDSGEGIWIEEGECSGSVVGIYSGQVNNLNDPTIVEGTLTYTHTHNCSSFTNPCTQVWEHIATKENDNTDNASDLTGTWSGTWYNTTYSMVGGITVDLTQNGTSFTGSGTVTNSPCATTGNLSGTISGNNMTFGIGFESGETLEFTGTYTSNSFNGTWTMDAGSCAKLDQVGTFSLTRQ